MDGCNMLEIGYSAGIRIQGRVSNEPIHHVNNPMSSIYIAQKKNLTESHKLFIIQTLGK